jgi:(p)ppGpp synthase/HD superfamily hydrolase
MDIKDGISAYKELSYQSQTFNRLREHVEKALEGKKYGDGPYTDHIDDLHDILMKGGWMPWSYPSLHGAAELHDVFEDTDYKPEFFSSQGIPQSWIDIALAVTDEPGASRKERKSKTYPKIRANPSAVLIKLCDRLANVRRRSKNDMYRREHPEFRAALYSDKDIAVKWIWEEIEKILGLIEKV